MYCTSRIPRTPVSYSTIPPLDFFPPGHPLYSTFPPGRLLYSTCTPEEEYYIVVFPWEECYIENSPTVPHRIV